MEGLKPTQRHGGRSAPVQPLVMEMEYTKASDPSRQRATDVDRRPDASLLSGGLWTSAAPSGYRLVHVRLTWK